MTFVHTRELAPNHGAIKRTAASSTAIVQAPAAPATNRIGLALARCTVRILSRRARAPGSYCVTS